MCRICRQYRCPPGCPGFMEENKGERNCRMRLLRCVGFCVGSPIDKKRELLLRRVRRAPVFRPVFIRKSKLLRRESFCQWKTRFP